MNQIGFVEISHIKNDRLFRALLPMGIPWLDAKDALLELAQQIEEYVKEQERITQENESAKEPALLDVLNNDKDQVLEAPVVPNQ